MSNFVNSCHFMSNYVKKCINLKPIQILNQKSNPKHKEKNVSKTASMEIVG